MIPLEALGCVSTDYRAGTFIGVYAGDVKIVLFWFLGRFLVICVYCRDVKLVWFWFLGRRKNGLVLSLGRCKEVWF